MDLKQKYIALHRQGWLPIFVADQFNAVELASVCVEAGLQAVEVTCRRNNAAAEIGEIKRHFPDLIVLAGSVVDNETLYAFLRAKRPDMPSIENLREAGADGFVAQFPLSATTLRTYSREYICISGVETLQEAVEAVHEGAHFTKFCMLPPERLKQLTGAPTHGLLPIFYTGGASLDKIPHYISAGAAIVGGGWDLMSGNDYTTLQQNMNRATLVGIVTEYKQKFDEARMAAGLGACGSDDRSYADSIPHYHPFWRDGNQG